MKISYGNSRFETKWKNSEISWEDFKKRVSSTIRTTETIEEYRKMTKAQQANVKDIGGFVAGHLKAGRRKKNTVLCRSALALDMDYGTPDVWDEVIAKQPYRCCAYSTHKHTAEKLRQQIAKSSVKKYQAMENCVCADGRCHGMFQFYGANRTGRWAGRLIQLQNLPQNHLPDLAEARALVRSGDFDMVKLLYEDVPDTLSQLIRTAFIPKENHKFYVADFSAIEARVIAWYAGEKWRQEVFENGGDIYCASASQMFHVPVEKHGINGHLRQKGKIAELALGYGGSVGALKAMGALEMGLSEEELQPLVSAWRQTNPHIVKFWWDVDRAVIDAVKYKRTSRSYGLTFSYQSGMLMITLPSGRNLVYVKPKIGTNKFGGQCITYEGVGSTKKWERIDSYGPKFVENIVQATSRDILCNSMKTLRHCSMRMLSDCDAGKIDIILTKSISRFARNTVDLQPFPRVRQRPRWQDGYQSGAGRNGKENLPTLSGGHDTLRYQQTA